MQKKFFITNKYKKIKLINIGIYIFIYILFLFGILKIYRFFPVFRNAITNLGIIGILFTLLFLTFTSILSLPLMAIYSGIGSQIVKKQKEKITFNSNESILYYRDLLKEESPATISLLMDLDLNSNRDKKAMLLYLQQKQALTISNENNIIINESVYNQLNKSDQVFIDYLSNKVPFYDWEHEVIEENIEKGYIRRKRYYDSSKKGCLLYFLKVLFFVILAIFATKLVLQDYPIYHNYISNAPSNISFEEQLLYIANSNMAVFFVIKLLICYLLYFILLWMILKGRSYLFFSFFFAIFSKKIKRTEKGDALTEKIYALKNFIHDFSSMKEKHLNELVLWKEFLIYAILLEENTQILDEINMSLYQIERKDA